MPLESCMILLDNSEYMRNGDYVPNRLEAQHDAANLLVGAKTQSHPESTVGVSAGTELLVSPTDDVGKILNALHGLPMRSAQPNVASSVQVASLALKHRRNKNGSQRIVLFVGSPLDDMETRALAKAGRQLKKNNVSIDVVAMGELEANEEKLRELVDAANGRSEEGAERTCHLVTIPAGVLPSDVLASSPIVHGGEGGSAFAASAAAGGAAGGGGGGDAGGGGGGFADFGGVDPNMDPELAMALRVSMEEERARQERATAAAAENAGGDDDNNDSNEATGGESKDAEMPDAAEAPAPAPAASAAQTAMDMGMSEEEALLQQALAMSMNENEPAAAAEEDSKEEEAKPAAAASMDVEGDDEDEDAAMQMALAMSMGGADGGNEEENISELASSIPGVDPDAIQDALKKEDKKDGDKK